MNVTGARLASIFLWTFVALFILLGLGYSSLTPIFENSDETLHYPYVKHLADGRGLPLAVANQLWNQEGTQHPLYYAIVAASTFWLNTDNLPDLLQRNPHWLYSEVRALINDNQNLVLHGPIDAFPYQRAALAVHIGRWWSLIFGLVTVVCTFLLARHLFPQNLPLVITATALTALNPQFIRVSATVSNDSLSAALATLAVLLAFKFTEPKKSANRQMGNSQFAIHNSQFIPPLLLGLLTGLALLTKLSSLTTMFLVAFIVFWRLFFLGELHQALLKIIIRWLVIIVVLTAVLSGWWFWRNYQLYGEWLATETHLDLAGRASLSLAGVWGLRAEAERAYWATFGWGQIRPPEWVYQILFGFTRIGLLGLIVAMLAKLIQGSKSRPLPLNLQNFNFESIIILLLWATLNLILYLRWVMEVGSVSHTRLMFPAIAAISLLLALGWHALIPIRWAGWFSGLVTVLLLALNSYSLGWLIYPAFTPAETPGPPLPAATPVELTFVDSLALEESKIYVPNKPATAKPQAVQGDTVMARVRWQVLAPLDKNYSVAIVLLAPDGSVLARRETYPGLGLRPTRYLHPGDTFVDVYPLQLETNVTRPVVARVAVTLFDFESETRAGFPALDTNGDEVTPIVGCIKLAPQPWPVYQPASPVQVNFEDNINLIGYDLTPDARGLTLYWKSVKPVDQDYSVFIHLLDASGNLIAQADAPPTGNAYPTSWWSPGEVIADQHLLPTRPAATVLRLGLYHLSTGQRLSVTGSILPGWDNSVEIELP
ncbi:MAG: phospholipid carrier-dependent glycosyltransferase [Anaerolineae bacterium]|nr:phospholipid carrier-dependent glycosyltransferase [Anaerolineae bacterium]